MKEKITLERLTEETVDIKIEKTIVQDGVEYPVGGIWRSYYSNDEDGILAVEKEVVEPYKSVILMMWGAKA